MTAERDYIPNTFQADQFQPGDRFAVPPQHNMVFEINERTDRSNLVVFETDLYNEETGETVANVTLTFFTTHELSARRRVRLYQVPCIICKKPYKHEVDSTYFTVLNGMCGCVQ